MSGERLCIVCDCYGRARQVPWTMYDPNRLVPYNAMFGQEAPAPAPPAETQTNEETLLGALRKITPTLLVVGVATGAAFAIGGGLVSRLVFRSR